MNPELMKFFIVFFLIVSFSGCVGSSMPNKGQLDIYPTPNQETDWIRNGEPIEFDGKLWYPQDGIENLLDVEMYLLGEYRGVQFFVEKTDVKPYDRLYTKFSRNRFRYFFPKPQNE